MIKGVWKDLRERARWKECTMDETGLQIIESMERLEKEYRIIEVVYGRTLNSEGLM